MNRLDRGDTLIEVLVAVVALSLVVIVCYTVMTRSFAQGQVALERTTTQGMLSAQLATLRGIFASHESAKAVNSDDADWAQIVSSYLSTTDIDPAQLSVQLQSARTPCQLNHDRGGFYFDYTTSGTKPSPTSPVYFPGSGVNVGRAGTFPLYGDGMWIEGYRVNTELGSASDAQPYYIFFAKSCWDAAITGERQSMVMSVRFYEAYN